MKPSTVALMLVAGLAMAGCNRSVNSVLNTGSDPQRLPSAPVDPVQSGQLPPPQGTGTDMAGLEPQPAGAAPTIPENSTQPAPAQPAPNGEPVTREAVSGTWTVSSDNSECRMILAFTKWSGGYRAATKRCESAELQTVSAWDVKGQQVVLMDGSGNTIARLYNSGGERFDGTTNSGQPVTFVR